MSNPLFPMIVLSAMPSSGLSNIAWDSNLWQVAVVTPREDHWLIERIDVQPPLNRKSDSQYLQIATGQWCLPQNATKFPSRSSAAAYAKEFGLSIGHTARLVRPGHSKIAA